MDAHQAYEKVPDRFEASIGKENEVHVLLPNSMVALKSLQLLDNDGYDLTVNQTKKELMQEIHMDDFNNVTLVLRKGNHEIVMNNDAKTVDYIEYFTNQYLVEIRLNK